MASKSKRPSNNKLKMKINLIPINAKKANVGEHLYKLFNESNSIKCAIAFWTISLEQLIEISGVNALPILKNSDSFICVDIQKPTNIDHLAKLKELGVDVYLNIRRLPKEFKDHSTSIGLLHTKILLADKNDNNNAEFWIGSHNWTQFALTGPNTEASLIIQLSKENALYSKAFQRLEFIRDQLCRPFDLSKIKFYKQLQTIIERGYGSKNVIVLQGDNIDKLGNQVIQIFGIKNEDYKDLKLVGANIYLSIQEILDPSIKYLYSGEILHSGRLEGYNPLATGINFTEKRRYAIADYNKYPPILKEADIVNQNLLQDLYYFVAIEIKKLETDNYHLLPLSKRESLWAEAEWDPMMESMSEPMDIFVPIDDERAIRKDIHDKDELTIKEKHKLINKKRIKKIKI